MKQTSTSCNVASTDSAEWQAGRDYDAEILDYEALVNRCMGNLDFVDRVLMKFHERLPLDLEELEQALAGQDAQLVQRLAHRIKGTAANTSAKGLQHIAQEIEDMGHSGCLAEIPARIQAFRKEWERVQAWSASVLSKTTSQ
ncbi:MAG TPA: Hpt domain-containing protein [Thermoguttaceae bacterium]